MADHGKDETTVKGALAQLRTLRAEMLDYDDDGDRPMANIPKGLRVQREREYAMLEDAIVQAGTEKRAREELLAAVRYALRRVCTDRNFRHYMLYTETLERCAGAFVLATGEEVMDQIEGADPGEADVVQLRREAEMVCDREPCGRCGPCRYAAEVKGAQLADSEEIPW